jgi:hypothetical protein
MARKADQGAAKGARRVEPLTRGCGWNGSDLSVEFNYLTPSIERAVVSTSGEVRCEAWGRQCGRVPLNLRNEISCSLRVIARIPLNQ